MRTGIHTSKSGSLERAALKAQELGANTFQIFSTSPRTWRTGTPDPDDIRNFHKTREKYALRPLVVHDSYLINLASCNAAIRASSIAAFRSELQRRIAIGADYLVMHPGNCKDQPLEQDVTSNPCISSQYASGNSQARNSPEPMVSGCSKICAILP